MPRMKVSITLTDDTLKRLEVFCQEMGLTRSQAISLAINSYVIGQKTKGGGNEGK